MRAKIKDKKEIAKDTLLVTFDLLGEKINFKPGQYFFITLLNPPYIDNDDRGSRRHFSIVNSPTQNNRIEMATRIRTESAFKKSLRDLPVGSEVEIGPIQGTFILPDNLIRPLVFVAGGIGITPFMSILRFIKDKNLPCKITLIYSNREQKSAAFLNELTSMEKQIHDFKLIATMTRDKNWIGEKRRIDEKFIKDYFKNPNDNTCMIASPPKMVEEVIKVLISAEVKEENIKSETFSGY